jgi:hypothetical protein
VFPAKPTLHPIGPPAPEPPVEPLPPPAEVIVLKIEGLPGLGVVLVCGLGADPPAPIVIG